CVSKSALEIRERGTQRPERARSIPTGPGLMLRQVGRRLVELAVVLFGVSVIVFLMIRLIPGDAVTIMLGANTEITPDRLPERLFHLPLSLRPFGPHIV